MQKHKHLRHEERFTIEKLCEADVSIREIAGFLGRSPNTVSRELRKNVVKGMYDAKKARLKVNELPRPKGTGYQ